MNKHKHRARQASQSSLLFSRNETGHKFLQSSIRSIGTESSFLKVSYDIHHSSSQEEKVDPSLALTEASTRYSIPFGKTVEEVYSGVFDGPILGNGETGVVRQVTNYETGQKFALKRLDMCKMKCEKQVTQLFEEIEIMCQLDHPNIIKLEEVYESREYVYLVEELCIGGELFDRLDMQPGYHYEEEECAHLIRQIVSAVQYIHSQGIVHRDLKLENFLFSKPDSIAELKMIDFGLSKHMKYGEKEKDAVGTPYTVAPEVIQESYTERCDVWAIGVMTYLLLSGDPPFGGCDGEPLKQVRANILSCRYTFVPTHIWDNVSEEAKAFIRDLLKVDPMERPSSRKLLWYPWLQRYNNSKDYDETDGDCWFKFQCVLQFMKA
jgi:calcium-dependent protein kinase